MTFQRLFCFFTNRSISCTFTRKSQFLKKSCGRKMDPIFEAFFWLSINRAISCTFTREPRSCGRKRVPYCWLINRKVKLYHSLTNLTLALLLSYTSSFSNLLCFLAMQEANGEQQLGRLSAEKSPPRCVNKGFIYLDSNLRKWYSNW